ncbi:MAG: hypothetical protein RR744_09740 [Cellulosilyticaceae bacterium]
MCYCRCRYEDSYTGECNNPSTYKYHEDAACYEPEEEEDEE